MEFRAAECDARLYFRLQEGRFLGSLFGLSTSLVGLAEEGSESAPGARAVFRPGRVRVLADREVIHLARVWRRVAYARKPQGWPKSWANLRLL